jgi:hypothetical protein
MQQPEIDINGKEFYGWRVSVEGKVDFGANVPDIILEDVRKAMLEGRTVTVVPQHWGTK